jgi:ATP-dependent helicase HepA
LFQNDPIVVERLARMENGDGEAAEELVAHVQEHYRIDRRIIRTRRRTLGEYGSHYAKRDLAIIAYDTCPAEVAVTEQIAELFGRKDVPDNWKAVWFRLACTTPRLLGQMLQTRLFTLAGSGPLAQTAQQVDPLATDLGPAEEESAIASYFASGPTYRSERTWLTETLTQVERWLQEQDSPSRFVALGEWLNQRVEAGRKTLVFSQSRAVVEELTAYLRARFGDDPIAVMTHNLDDESIAEVARRFESHPQCLVLVADEIGAEGHNFQIADAVVHLDQPTVVARIEQRIGRLDRVGRPVERPVLSVVILGPWDLEDAVLRINRDVFRVYERSIGGFEYLLPRLQQVVSAATVRGTQALFLLADKLRSQLDAEEKRVDEAFSFFLDATRPEFERARKLAELVADRSGDEDEAYVRDWCKELRIGFIPQKGSCVKVEARVERLDAPLPMTGARDWIKTGTFLRHIALQVPALQYFAPGHIFIDALLQSALNTQDARATAFFRDLGGKGVGRVFCALVGRLGPDEALFSESMSPGLWRRAEHYLPLEWVRLPFEIYSNGDVVPVPQGALCQQLTEDLHTTDRKCHPDEMSQVLEHFPGLWAGIRASVNMLKQEALALKKGEIKAAADELEDALRSELAYLRSCRSSLETKRELRDREALLASVRSPSVQTDAVAIVIGREVRGC